MLILLIVNKYYYRNTICVVEPVVSLLPDHKVHEEKRSTQMFDLLVLTRDFSLEFIEIKSFSAGAPAGIELFAHVVSFPEKLVDNTSSLTRLSNANSPI